MFQTLLLVGSQDAVLSHSIRDNGGLEIPVRLGVICLNSLS